MQKNKNREMVKHLVELGKEKGFLTYDEVNNLLPPEIIASDKLDDIIMLFGEERIELIDASEETRFRRARTQTKKSKAGDKEEIDLTPGTIGKTDDPVRMYLREMGTVPLLTREGEVEIAKRIEVGRKNVHAVICEMPFVVEDVLRWMPLFDENLIRLRDILTLSPDEDENMEAFEESQKTKIMLRLKEIEKLRRRARNLHEKIRGRKVTGDARKKFSAEGSALESTEEPALHERYFLACAPGGLH